MRVQRNALKFANQTASPQSAFQRLSTLAGPWRWRGFTQISLCNRDTKFGTRLSRSQTAFETLHMLRYANKQETVSVNLVSNNGMSMIVCVQHTHNRDAIVLPPGKDTTPLPVHNKSLTRYIILKLGQSYNPESAAHSSLSESMSE